MAWLKKTKTALFALLMSFASLAQTHAQALPQEKLNTYILKIHELHHQGTNAVEADKEFTQLTNEIHQHLQTAAASCVREGDLGQAIVHTALIQKLAEAVRDEHTAQEARLTNMFLQACEQGRVLEEQLPAQEAVAALLNMSKEEIQQYLKPQQEQELLLDLQYPKQVRIRYFITTQGGVAAINNPPGAPLPPKEDIIQDIRAQTKHLDTQQQNKIIKDILRAINNRH